MLPIVEKIPLLLHLFHLHSSFFGVLWNDIVDQRARKDSGCHGVSRKSLMIAVRTNSSGKQREKWVAQWTDKLIVLIDHWLALSRLILHVEPKNCRINIRCVHHICAG